LGEEGLTGPGRADHQNVALLKLDIFEAVPVQNSLVMIVHGDRQDFLRAVLPNHVLVKDRFDFGRFRQWNVSGEIGSRDGRSFGKERAAELDAFIANEKIEAGATGQAVIRPRTFDQTLHHAFLFAAKGTLAIAFLPILS
jgi:hypothetical protein